MNKLYDNGIKEGKRMKILVASIDMMPQNISRQPWYYMNSIVKSLLEKDHAVWVLSDKDQQWFDNRRTLVSKRFRTFPHGVNSQFRTLVKQKDFDLIIWSIGLTDFFLINKIDKFEIPVIGVVGSPRYNLRELLTLGSDLFSCFHYVKHFFLGTIITEEIIKGFLSIPNLKGIIFQCQETLNRYIPDNVSKKRIYVLPPPLPADFSDILNEISQVRNAYAKKYPKVLYFGPPLNIRGIDNLIHAINIVRGKIPNVHLDILSRIEHESLMKREDKMRKLVKQMDLSSYVNIVSGILTPKEILKYILSTDVVCLPYKCVVSDTPISVLETLATGKPLITTTIIDVSDFVQNGNCWVVQPGNYRALAGTIVTVLKRDSEQMKKSNKDQILAKCSFENFSLSFEQIMGSVLK